jgi:ribonuclease R
MLPEVLSNEWCSLKPNVDRLCMVCEMFVTKFGRVSKIQFYEGVMRSAARLTYTQVGKFFDGDNSAISKNIQPHLQNLHSLQKILHKRRNKQGIIDFSTKELNFVLDKDKKVKNIITVKRNDAHKLVEEMMLAANVATAEWLTEKQIPLLYRIHEIPNEEKLTQLRLLLGDLKLKLYGDNKPKAHHYAKLLKQIEESPQEHLVQTVLLRSMQMAIYSPENKGHFGLAFENYAHFTSPIRRYPDLLIHRAIKHILRHKNKDNFEYTHDDLAKIGEHCSMTERRADEATRGADAWLKCDFMSDKVGKTYDGIITAVTSFGLFIELDDLFVEGLVHVSTLPDYYEFDAVKHCLTGEKSGNVYHLSDKVKVIVTRVNVDERKIDFTIVN